jgi:hypothetical protein
VIRYNGKSQSVAAWARELGISALSLRWRLDNGWSVERALSIAPSKHNKRIDITGERFGRLVALSAHSYGKQTRWNCVCDCGERRVVLLSQLRDGKTQSCGCLHIERVKAARTHGMASSPEYTVWRSMLDRCRNPNGATYARYGGRGIAVCARWQGSFEAFYADMGPRPSPEHSIDRIDNSGNYEPGNCRWATHTEQALNKRNNRFIEWNGARLTVTQWAGRIGVSQSALSHRLSRGEDPCAALSALSRYVARRRAA